MKSLTKQQRNWVIAQFHKVKDGVLTHSSMLAYKKHCANLQVEDDSAKLKVWAYSYCNSKPYASLTDVEKAKVCAKLEREIAQWK